MGEIALVECYVHRNRRLTGEIASGYLALVALGTSGLRKVKSAANYLLYINQVALGTFGLRKVKSAANDLRYIDQAGHMRF